MCMHETILDRKTDITSHLMTFISSPHGELFFRLSAAEKKSNRVRPCFLQNLISPYSSSCLPLSNVSNIISVFSLMVRRQNILFRYPWQDPTPNFPLFTIPLKLVPQNTHYFSCFGISSTIQVLSGSNFFMAFAIRSVFLPRFFS